MDNNLQGKGSGCTLIFGLKLQTECLRALMEFAKNVLIFDKIGQARPGLTLDLRKEGPGVPLY